MESENQSTSTKFFIVGFSDFPELRIPLFIIFLLIYLLTLGGNLLIVTLICCNSHLHIPMYYFLTNLSFIDVTFITAIFPKMLSNFFTDAPFVSLKECLVQLCFFIATVYAEFVLLTIMAYDRYVAICKPLHYTVIMNRSLCCKLTCGAFILSLLEPIPYSFMTSALSFCESHQINHFFCDITALMKISCTSTQNLETMIYATGLLVGVFSLVPILVSYIHILAAILKIQTADGRSKAFNTCASHVTVVMLFYGSLLIMYLRPRSMYSMNENKIFALLYCGFVPLLNPVIYSLKNKDLRDTLKKAIWKRTKLQR